MRYDFHAHTHYSDGVLSPSQLVARAGDKGVELLAISDHDSISGIAEAREFVNTQGMDLTVIEAIELSAQSNFGEIHIVGLNIDSNNTDLVALTKQQQQKRWSRVEAMELKFKKLNVEGVLADLVASCKQVVTRSHVARSLIKLGYVKDNNQAFKKYMGKKGRVKVATDWVTMEQAISTIKGAGGLAILAHPTRYAMSNRKLSYLIEEFQIAGGDAIELSYPSISPDKMGWLEIQRSKNNLLASGGSDFHYPDLKWSDLGRFPRIRDGIPHVLNSIKENMRARLDK